jgi:hypothetical protein
MDKAKNCKICGVKMIWENPQIPGHFHESSCYLGGGWPICHSCMIEHCLSTNCLGCEYGQYPKCRFLKMKRLYAEERDNA